MRFVLAAAVASAVTYANDNTLTPTEKKAGWILLFDGRTLNEWDDPSKKTPPGDSWTIEDGAIKARKAPRIREDLVTRRTFRDFELLFDWRISPAGNSGVKYRIQSQVLLVRGKLKPGTKRFEEFVDWEYENRAGDRSALGPEDRAESYPIAFEYQVIDNAHPDAARGAKQQAGGLYGMIAPSEAAAKAAGEWNSSRIVVTGANVEHWLNGKKVVDSSLAAPEIMEGLEKRWGKQSPVYKLLTRQPERDCAIALQNHNDEAWFKNLKIRELKP